MADSADSFVTPGFEHKKDDPFLVYNVTFNPVIASKRSREEILHKCLRETGFAFEYDGKYLYARINNLQGSSISYADADGERSTITFKRKKDSACAYSIVYVCKLRRRLFRILNKNTIELRKQYPLFKILRRCHLSMNLKFIFEGLTMKEAELILFVLNGEVGDGAVDDIVHQAATHVLIEMFPNMDPLGNIDTTGVEEELQNILRPEAQFEESDEESSGDEDGMIAPKGFDQQVDAEEASKGAKKKAEESGEESD